MSKLRAGVAMRTAEDWAEAALDVIAQGGLRALAIPDLARTLGVTKGSFYWHFPSLDALVDAALERWEMQDRAALERVAETSDARQRMVQGLTESMTATRSHALFITLASSDDPRVKAVLRRVSARRMRWIVDAYRDYGFEGDDLRVRALLAHTAYIGVVHLHRQDFPGLRTAKDIETYATRAVGLTLGKRKN